MLWAALNSGVYGAFEAPPRIWVLWKLLGFFGCVRHMPDPEEWKRLAAEQRAIRESVADITFAWSNVESNMAILLSGILGEPSGAFSSAIYFSPASSETRIKIVDAAFDTLVGASPQRDAIMSVWGRTLRRINRYKDTRNAVAHGTVSTVGLGGKNHVRLTASFFDWRRIGPAIAKKQVPGFGSNDIAASAEAMREMSQILTHFWKVAEALRKGDEPTLRETLLQIEADLKKGAPQQAAPIQSTPDTQPRPSRASLKAARKKLWKKT